MTASGYRHRHRSQQHIPQRVSACPPCSFDPIARSPGDGGHDGFSSSDLRSGVFFVRRTDELRHHPHTAATCKGSGGVWQEPANSASTPSGSEHLRPHPLDSRPPRPLLPASAPLERPNHGAPTPTNGRWPPADERRPCALPCLVTILVSNLVTGGDATLGPLDMHRRCVASRAGRKSASIA